MWTRGLLKRNAWDALKSYYWVALGVTVLATIMGANRTLSVNFNFNVLDPETMESMEPEELIFFIVGLLIGLLTAWVFIIAWVAFLTGPAKCGMCRFFCCARNGDPTFSHLFDNFKKGSYLSTVKTMFLVNLYTWLWSLLFVIPGIIKAYEYMLIPYLLAENPQLPKDRAFEISKKTMDGEKWKVFVLELSFIGWWLLGFLACCVGVYFVAPYLQATYAEFYMCMRAKMIAYGYTTEEELSGISYDNSFGGFGGGSFSGNPYYNESGYTTPDSYFPSNSYDNTNSGNPYNNPYDQ